MNDFQIVNDAILTALEKLRIRLLDLTPRNRLLNFSHSKFSSLRVIDELPNKLHEVLLTEEEMRFMPIPEPTREQLIKAGYIKINENTGKDQLIKDPSAEEWARILEFQTSRTIP